MDVLVIDIGGSHVKLMATRASASRRFDSNPTLTPDELVRRVLEMARDWDWDVVALGYPGAVDAKGTAAEPGNLGNGWVRFDFARSFGTPVRIINDAVMQALGGYDGGRMLFLGLGTGLGSALVTEHVVEPLELGQLLYGDGTTIGEHLGREGRDRQGQAAWLQAVRATTRVLKAAFAADYIVLGGGNAEHVDPLPDGTRRGGNDDAFRGGFRLWEEVVEPHDRHPPPVWRVVR